MVVAGTAAGARGAAAGADFAASALVSFWIADAARCRPGAGSGSGSGTWFSDRYASASATSAKSPRQSRSIVSAMDGETLVP
ncbi:MAG: hypothetical protein HMLKMBBP_01270 [Planctomycetes bacterium]|nr:hypothetical protein [Planctomycetota bacterium]